MTYFLYIYHFRTKLRVQQWHALQSKSFKVPKRVKVVTLSLINDVIVYMFMYAIFCDIIDKHCFVEYGKLYK